jgi:predicted DCC family thiol-disulfide oxidoreductase YuxK
MRLLDYDKHRAPPKARPFRVGVPSAAPANATGDVIFFDGTCGLCSASAKRLRRIVSPRGFRFEPFQSSARFNDVPDEMKLLTHDGALLGGADAIVYVSRRIWWGWPLWAIAQVPGVMALLRTLYRRLAANRHRISGACRL